MKKIITAAALLLFAATAMSQQPAGQQQPLPEGEKAEYRTKIEGFVELYNKGDYDLIYAQFAPIQRGMMTKDSTLKFFTELKKESGKIKKVEFLRWANPIAARYKVVTSKKDTMVFNFAYIPNGMLASFKKISWPEPVPAAKPAQ